MGCEDKSCAECGKEIKEKVNEIIISSDSFEEKYRSRLVEVAPIDLDPKYDYFIRKIEDKLQVIALSKEEK